MHSSRRTPITHHSASGAELNSDQSPTPSRQPCRPLPHSFVGAQSGHSTVAPISRGQMNPLCERPSAALVRMTYASGSNAVVVPFAGLVAVFFLGISPSILNALLERRNLIGRRRGLPTLAQLRGRQFLDLGD